MHSSYSYSNPYGTESKRPLERVVFFYWEKGGKSRSSFAVGRSSKPERPQFADRFDGQRVFAVPVRGRRATKWRKGLYLNSKFCYESVFTCGDEACLPVFLLRDCESSICHKNTIDRIYVLYYTNFILFVYRTNSFIRGGFSTGELSFLADEFFCFYGIIERKDEQ